MLSSKNAGRQWWKHQKDLINRCLIWWWATSTHCWAWSKGKKEILAHFFGYFILSPLFSPAPYSLHILDHFCDPLPAPTFQMLRIVLGRIVSLNYVGSKVRYQRHIWLALVIKSHYTAKSWCACVRLLIFSLVPWFVITRKRSRENRFFVWGVSHFFVFFFPTATSCEQVIGKRQKLHYLNTLPISANSYSLPFWHLRD